MILSIPKIKFPHGRKCGLKDNMTGKPQHLHGNADHAAAMT